MESLQNKRPCRKHYFQMLSFSKCSDCGWSGTTDKEPLIVHIQGDIKVQHIKGDENCLQCLKESGQL